jgi:DNA-binding transcriptional MerR regulator
MTATSQHTARVELTVGQVAESFGVTVRTLHHYDDIGLLRPTGRTAGGYRVYGEDDLERLHEILVYRELDLPLDGIRAVMSASGLDRAAVLHGQLRQLIGQKRRLERVIAAVEKAIRAEETGMNLTKEEMFEVFGDFDPAEHEDEVKERWGDTDAYAESARRTKRYTKQDWLRMKEEQEAQGARMVALFDAGVEPTDPRAMDVADEARLIIDKWFYPCSREMHVCLGEMYVADPRFKANYEKMREGLAQWLYDAIKANDERGE